MSSIERRRERARSRGATLVEAVLVASMLVLALIGAVFVARTQQVGLRVVAVSRAAAVRESLSACEERSDEGFGKAEKELLAGVRTEDGGQGSPAPRASDAAAQQALTRASRSGGFGSPQIVTTTTEAKVMGPLNDASRPGGRFASTVAASDRILCAERAHTRGSLGVLGFARDFFKF